MNAIVLEDEAVALRRLKKMLNRFEVTVIAEASSLEDFSKLGVLHEKVDLYFLDIHLSDGNVFDYLQKNPTEKPIIFTTAYDQYAMQAFKQFSIDYLLKPFSQEDLSDALQKYEQHFRPEPGQMSELIQHLNQRQRYSDRILIKIGDKLKSLPLTDVDLMYSEQKTTMVRTKQQRSYPVDFTLSEIHEKLDPRRFFQVNRGMILHIDAIHEIHIYSNSRLKVQVPGWSGPPIIVARERVSDFKKWLG
ncbi:MAG: response regulator [Bacteroidetes bacterium]|jgi:DNA-binding LytR/AlgR family response regulator|nr:response regulator [Bacteroidota bacterium]